MNIVEFIMDLYENTNISDLIALKVSLKDTKFTSWMAKAIKVSQRNDKFIN